MNDEQAMQFALNLAKSGSNQTSPNPLVGCVITNNQEVVGFGAHLKSGEAHAEINALKIAGEKAKGANVYVTLEPCSHVGRTGPCVEALIKAQVAHVFIATLDPNPLIAGSGARRLEEAGITVSIGLCEDGAKAINEAFFYYIVHRLPYVTLKQAISIDGKINAEKGQRTAITGKEVQKDVHYARSIHDAILVGSNTVCIDNPSLTNRLSSSNKQPIRVVMDRDGKVPSAAKVFNDKMAQTWLFTSKARNLSGVRTFVIEDCSLRNILRTLADEGIMTLYVEAGSQMADVFLQQRFVQKMIIYIAPKLLGSGALSMATLQEEFIFTDVEKIGEAIKLTMTMK
ncbi:bifunctional diaminohydroxyphosphoribosylaminopyrimidine deaminase/5-amino-6-(5-phosphoribosylamino)uracil reductase RibD [Lysinibacillus louembei]|uniref:Riboflavin biosynthesis protein RibD n=1 Tax=Lysinibacillus louembei TaxID=1470088 RepID=A0ABZ0RS08_9BACI|nr:bifunctional diaminohydroxyphosphoribosylaminopyrimidine deaminase/5-amino-6-(5-phosphoribosylamino)uracil reductase RibD [Lysinibacillus louembei]WPK10920.1 bifunctional diaminohydroxyphosphoribosylaminopyrimidine deaminase/5-amino-6-(5-phosphoribosylamino)uracil reductase RibD [Lysinibacillus louembei]